MTENIGTFDYIIAGGGTAGCVLANRLSADPSVRVLLLEAGGSSKHLFVEVPLFLQYMIGNPKFDWMYRSSPEPWLNDRVLTTPRGRMLGGSSSINGMVYVRGHAWDYDNWAALGNSGWSWADVLPYFRRSEALHGPSLPGHGKGGEWPVSDPGVRWDIVDAYRDAAVECGIPLAKDYNCGDNEGTAYFVANILNGRRASTAKSFLFPVAGRPNLKVVTGALVDRVILQDRRATGVCWHQAGGGVASAAARREVILTGGAFGSPAILERSGIGAGQRLKDLGIEVEHDLPGVGENLQDHWQIRVQHRVSGTRTLNDRAGSLLGRALMGMQYFGLRGGPLSAQPALLAAFTRVMPGAPAPDVQIHVSAASYDRVGGPLHKFSGISSAVCILRPESRGHVHITERKAEAAPEILHNFLSSDLDCQIAIRAVELVRKIGASPAMGRFKATDVSPGPGVTSDEDIIAYARRVVSTVFHPVGTCRMGSDETAVVGPDLTVRGLTGLRVADASIMPRITSGNTAAPVVMIAEKAADLIVGRQAAAAA